MSNPYISKKWPGVLHRKIDIYLSGKYMCSTNAYINTAQAVKGVAYEKKLYIHGTTKPVEELKAFYA